jgi:hypothetical protein
MTEGGASAQLPHEYHPRGGFIPGVVAEVDEAEVDERDPAGNVEVTVEGGGEGIRVSRDLSDRLYAGLP